MAKPLALPILIERHGWGCLMTVPLTICALGWVGLCFRIWYSEQLFHDDPIFNWSMATLAILGIALWVYGIRSQYYERINITEFEVNYFKKGLLRRTTTWGEPLQHYKGVAIKTDTGIAKTGVESETEYDLFMVILQHKSRKSKNIVVEKEAPTKADQVYLQEEYAKLLKLPKV